MGWHGLQDGLLVERQTHDRMVMSSNSGWYDGGISLPELTFCSESIWWYELCFMPTTVSLILVHFGVGFCMLFHCIFMQVQCLLQIDVTCIVDQVFEIPLPSL